MIPTDDFVRFDDALIASSTEKLADEYFDRVWATMKKKQKDSVARAYFGISLSQVRRVRFSEEVDRRQRGGCVELGTLDPAFVEMLAAVDTFHDFDEGHDVSDIVDGRLPVGFSVEELDREKFFLKKLASKRELVFGNRTIKNPAYRCNLLKRMEIRADMVDIDAIFRAEHASTTSTIVQNSSTTILPVDILTRYSRSSTAKYEFFKLRQLATLMNAIQRKFRSVRGESGQIDMLVDGSLHPLLAIMIGVKHMWGTFRKKFCSDPPTDTYTELSEKLRVLIEQEDAHSTRRSITVRMSDATIFDSANSMSIALDVDHRRTGHVFPPEVSRMYDGCSVVLNGIPRDGQKKALVNLHGHEIAISSSEAKDHFSIAHINKIVTGTRRRASTLDSILASDAFSRKSLLAIKLAGDWGQAENASTYGKVFVTSDKMAATYAYCRQVPFVFVSYDGRITVDDDAADDSNDFFRYTFALGFS